jgi:mono/diheme cytochrome c family protein
MRNLVFVTMGLMLACEKHQPTIIDKEPSQTAPESLDPATVSSQVDIAPIPAEGPPKGPPVPVLDDGTPLHPPPLPPGMKPDPNSNDLQSIFTRNCAICHGETGEGRIEGVPNYQETPQPLNNSTESLIKDILNGHGKAPAMRHQLKDRTVFHLIEYMRGRVGQARIIMEINEGKHSAPKPTPATP